MSMFSPTFSAAQLMVYEQVLNSIMNVKVGAEDWKLAKEEARKHAVGACAFSSAGIGAAESAPKPPKAPKAPKAPPKAPKAATSGSDDDDDMDTLGQLQANTGPEPERPKPAKKAPAAAKGGAGGAGGKAPKAPKERAGSSVYKPPTKKELKEAKKPRATTQYMAFSSHMQAKWKKENRVFADLAAKMTQIGVEWAKVPEADKVKLPEGKWQKIADDATQAKLDEWYENQGIAD